METQLNLTKTERLTLWNQKRFEAFLPTTIFLNFCAVVGLFGNGVVIYIYGLRLHAKNAGRYFIPYLAVADLLALVISAELHTVSNSTPVTYKFETFCKWNFVAALFVTVYSISILLIIAVQRYLKVCKPFGGQKSSKILVFGLKRKIFQLIKLSIHIYMYVLIYNRALPPTPL